MLRLHGVVAGYGGGDVLQGVDIDVDQGSVVCIVGPNGAGKSTVLRTVSGLLNPRLGEVHLQGEPIHRCTPAEILRRGVSQVPQANALFPNLTVKENVLLGHLIPAGTGFRPYQEIKVKPLVEIEDDGESEAEMLEEAAAAAEALGADRTDVVQPHVEVPSLPSPGISSRPARYSGMPAPPATVSSTKAIRTSVVSTPR